MKQFVYKTIIVIIAIVVIYEFTVSKQIKQITKQSEIILSKEGRKEGIEKLREELKKAIKKERYLSNEDAKLINEFIKKIAMELKDGEN